MPRILTAQDSDYWNGRMNAAEAEASTMAARMSAAETDMANRTNRLVSLENWRSSRASAIADVTVAPAATSVSILGIEVPTFAGFTSLVNAFNTMKASHNQVLAALRSREINTA